MNTNIESGFFLNKIPYVKHWTENSKKTLVILPGAINLLYWLSDPNENATNNRLFVPEEYILYVLGYDKDLPSNHTFDKMVEEYATILKDNIGPATILATSYGGNLAIPLSAQYPELVEKLLLVTSAHSFSDDGVKFLNQTISVSEKGNMKHVINQLLRLNNKILYKILLRLFLKKQKEIYTNHYPVTTIKNAMTNLVATKDDRKKYLPQIQAPTLVIGGTKDKVISEELYRETAELIPNGKVKIFDGAGHMVTVVKAMEVKKVIFDFLLNDN